MAIIPARFQSQRLPGKALLDIAGRPMIAHVLERVQKARGIDRILVATDDERIGDAVTQWGVEARLTSPRHASGTDRIAEVAATLDAEIIVNVQCDEPLIDPHTIEAALAPLLCEPSVMISTTSEPITELAEVLNPHVVKVVSDRQGFALYFSRSPIPHIRRDQSLDVVLRAQPEWLRFYRRHTGLYVYRRTCLLRLSQLDPSPLEQLERLEQLRALEHGIPIRVVPVEHRSIGVDTPEDLQRVRALYEERRHHG